MILLCVPLPNVVCLYLMHSQENRNCFHSKHFTYHMITSEIVVTGVVWWPWPWCYDLDSSPYRLQRVLVAVLHSIVYIYRNPKDVAISSYHHFTKAMAMLDCNAGDLDGFKKAFPTSTCKMNLLIMTYRVIFVDFV